MAMETGFSVESQRLKKRPANRVPERILRELRVNPLKAKNPR